MVLTIEEKIERQKISNKKYRENNREKIKEISKKYRENNREKESERKKKYRQDNKEKTKERDKKNNQTPNRKKSQTIYNWKQSGLQDEDMSALYEQYLIATNCDECNVEFGKIGDGTNTWKCMDHDHETNLFRNFLCNKCNVKRG